MSWVAAGVAGAQLAFGVVKKIKADKDAKNAKSRRTPYKTPEEISKILNASFSGAQGDTIAENSRTNQLDMAFSQALGTSTRLGADPNDLSALFGQKMQGIFANIETSHKERMEGFSKVLAAYNLVADNKAAEWKSKQDFVKDDLQAAAESKKDAMATIGSALNAGISINSSEKIKGLYGGGGKTGGPV